tara:strand:- start:289 stop:453 length:165 start_codon:yes stop_codon:yes gene_type:complete
MQNESLNNSKNKSYSQNIKIKKENIICKDGFCSLSNHNKISNIDKDDMNLFDPI